MDPDVACKDVDFAIMVSAEHDVPDRPMPSPWYRVHPPRLLPGTLSSQVGGFPRYRDSPSPPPGSLPSQVGGFPRKAGMERKDVMAKNVTIYRDQASALAKYASKDVKVSVAPTHLPQSWPRMLHVPPPAHLLSPTVHPPTRALIPPALSHSPLPGACGCQPCQYQCAHPQGVRARRRPREHHMPYTA